MSWRNQSQRQTDIWRRTGRTTRLVDQYIQMLFKDGQIIIRDHHDTDKMHEFTFRTVLTRLQVEHPGVMVESNKQSFTIRLKNNE